MLTKNRTIWTAIPIVALMAFPVIASAQQLVDFFQLDASRDVQTVVFVKGSPFGEPQKPSPLLSAAYSRWENGSTVQAGYVYRWALTTGEHKLSVGAGGGVDHFHSKDSDDKTRPDARGQLELSGPAPGGTYYTLGQISTFRRASLALVQYNVADSPWGVEGSYYSETGHHHFTGAVRYTLGASKWFLRGGVIASDTNRPFIGVGYNGF
jgi:hypothetical protein